MSQPTETAILAGGCFWGMQDLIRRYPGVISTRVGYSGGDVANATYRNHGTHAEAIEIVFDPEQLSYRKLLEFFFQTKFGQGAFGQIIDVILVTKLEIGQLGIDCCRHIAG